MLILERHSGESILINDDTKLTIYYNKGSQVKIGIDAPRHVSIMREELLTAINNEKKSTIKSGSIKPEAVSSTQNESEHIESPEFIQENTQKTPQVIIKTKRKKRIILPVK